MSTRNGSSWSAISRGDRVKEVPMTEGVCAGVDWAKDTHEVLVADSEGERLWGATVAHDEAGIDQAVPGRWSRSGCSGSRSSAPTGC